MKLKLKVFVDYLFLSNFFQKIFDADVNDEIISEASNIVRTILFKYTEKIVRITNISNEEYEILKHNPLYEQCLDSGDFDIQDDIEDYIRENDCYYSLFFMYDNKSWFDQVTNKGAFCFSWNNYKKEIKKIISECHYKIDLSEGKFLGWSILLKNLVKLPTNQIIITDKYLLKKDVLEFNIVPILEQFLKSKIKLELILLAELGTDSKSIMKNKLDVYLETLKKCFSSNNLDLKFAATPFHDRIIYSHYFMIDSTYGFDKKNFNKDNNSLIIAETIFSEFTYKRILRHKRILTKYFNSHKNSDYNLVSYPENISIEIT